jgi:hypothetical protein
MHGGVQAYFGIIAIYTVGEALSRRPWWPYLLLFLLSALSTLINPYGVDYWTYLFQAVTLTRASITEWVSVFDAYRYGISPGSIVFYMLIVVLSEGPL